MHNLISQQEIICSRACCEKIYINQEVHKLSNKMFPSFAMLLPVERYILEKQQRTFFHTYILSSQHLGGQENSQRLCKPLIAYQVGIAFSDTILHECSPKHLWRRTESRKKMTSIDLFRVQVQASQTIICTGLKICYET